MATESRSSRVDAVRQVWPDIHEVIKMAKPQDAQQALLSAWNKIRSVIRGLETEVLDLEAQVMRQEVQAGSQPGSVVTVSRPTTSDSLMARRVEMESQMDEMAAGKVPTETIRALQDLDPQWVATKLHASRSMTKEASANWRFGPQGTGCWIPGQASGHNNGYVRLNLRNTINPRTNQRLGVNPYMHQLAAVAGGLGGRLSLAGKNGTHQVSHLCHNTACMNPVHVTIEPVQKNTDRKCCNGAVLIRFPDGSIVNPCKCWHDGSPACVLPTWSKPNLRGYWRFTEDGPVQRN